MEKTPKNQNPNPQTQPDPSAVQKNSDTLDVLFEMNRLLNCGLSRNKLATCIQLIELGVSPEALARLIREQGDLG